MSDTVELSFHVDALGTPGPDRRYSADAKAIAAYAQATNDDAPTALDGSVAPSTFAIVAAWDGIDDGNILAVGEADLRAIEDRIVHGEQWMSFHRPIVPGDVLGTVARVVGIHPKSSGTTVATHLATADAAGQVVCDQWTTAFYRGVTSAEDVGEVAPSLKSVAGPADLEARRHLASVALPVDPDQPRRYADASGDHHAIHLDDEIARSTGLPGVIVHGMCTLAFAARALRMVAAQPGPAPFTQIGCRFTRPLLPGGELVTRVDALPAEDGLLRLGFECLDAEGNVVLGSGYGELARG